MRDVKEKEEATAEATSTRIKRRSIGKMCRLLFIEQGPVAHSGTIEGNATLIVLCVATTIVTLQE